MIMVRTAFESPRSFAISKLLNGMRMTLSWVLYRLTPLLLSNIINDLASSLFKMGWQNLSSSGTIVL